MYCDICKIQSNLFRIELWHKTCPTTSLSFSESLYLMKMNYIQKYRCNACIEGLKVGDDIYNHVVRGIIKYDNILQLIDRVCGNYNSE